MEKSKPQYASQIKSAGIRSTIIRTGVMAALEHHPHSDTETVMQGVREHPGTASPQAIYNALASLASKGLIRRIEPAGKNALYELRVGDNHHHIVCRSCGLVRDIPCIVGSAPCLTPSDTAGYIIDEAEITFWGTCQDCADKAKNSGDDFSATSF